MNKRFFMTSTLLLGIVLTLACNLFTSPSPTATIRPTSTPIPGWEKFKGAGIELWLPESFEGGDLSQDLEVIVGKLRTLGSDFEQTAKTIEQNPSAFAIWAFDSKASDSGFLTNVNIIKEKVLSAVTIDTYMDAVAKKLPPSFKIVDRKKVKLEHYEAMQVVIELELPNVQAKELIYVIKHSNVMWVITYATGKSEYEQQLPVFEQSANTFNVQP